MRTGDIVLHRPTGEEWLVAWADPRSGYMAPCGWPTCQALIADCDLVERASDEKCSAIVAEVSRSGRSDAHMAEVCRALSQETSDD